MASGTAGRRSSGVGFRPSYNQSAVVRFYIDPSTNEPHIYGHDVSEQEVEDVLTRPIEDRPGTDRSRVAVGQTQAGRYLRVIYVPDPEPKSVFVITGYELARRRSRHCVAVSGVGGSHEATQVSSRLGRRTRQARARALRAAVGRRGCRRG